MKTAVEWLEEFMENGKQKSEGIVSMAFAKAKAMEKDQIMDAFESAEKDCGRDFLHGDLYYNETFKTK